MKGRTMMQTMKTDNPGASPEAIQYHYDIGNDFYRLWLDSTLTYSGALWKEGDTLESAQQHKIDWHINQARAHGATRVLDVGCGWGSVLRRLVDVHGVERAVGLTLSAAQLQWITAFNHPQLEVRLESWSDHVPDEPYDAIISLGAFEHFAQFASSNAEKVEGYRAFFARCHAWLKPGGWLSLQTMAYGDLSRDKHHSDLFIANDIFPQSDFPRLADIAEASERIFEVVLMRNDRSDYVRTYREWFNRLRAQRTEAVRLVGEEVVARYERYLRMFSYSFELGAFSLLRLALRRIDRLRK
jgi:cyclopropane-fatty-acyl-phospholipid synthase